MKKVLLSAIATLAIGVSIVNAGDREVGIPRDQDGHPVASSDYAGVSISTIAVSSANAQLFVGDGVIIGFIASSNTAQSDFIIFRSTPSLTAGAVDAGTGGTGDYTTTDEICRVYLSSIAVGNTATYGTIRQFPAPIRVKRGATAKASTNLVNMITVLWHKFGADDTGENP